MKLASLKPSIVDLEFHDKLTLVKERRNSRFVSKRDQRPKHIQKKIDEVNSTINMLPFFLDDMLNND